MRIGGVSAGLGEQGGGLAGCLLAGGTGRVLGDALKCWQSLGADATEDVGRIEGAAVPASVAGQKLQVWYGCSGIWAEGCEREGGHFQMDLNPVRLGPNKGAFWGDSGELIENRGSGTLDIAVVRIGSEPSEEARQGVGSDLPDRLFRFARARVAVEGVGVAVDPLREGAASIGS